MDDESIADLEREYAFDTRQSRHPRAVCPGCGQLTPLNKDGKFRIHTVKSGAFSNDEIRDFCQQKTPEVKVAANQKDVLRRRLQNIEDELAKLEALPDDDFEEGSVISFDKTFDVAAPTIRRSESTYTYIAVKVGVRWYTTRRDEARDGRSWEDLIEFILLHESTVPDIYYVSAWERMT